VLGNKLKGKGPTRREKYAKGKNEKKNKQKQNKRTLKSKKSTLGEKTTARHYTKVTEGLWLKKRGLEIQKYEEKETQSHLKTTVREKKEFQKTKGERTTGGL